jgi:hypothetical protein
MEDRPEKGSGPGAGVGRTPLGSDVVMHRSPAIERQSPFGSALANVLRRQVPGLSEIHWFRTDWQRGGALTGYASLCLQGQTEALGRPMAASNGSPAAGSVPAPDSPAAHTPQAFQVPVVVKFPVPPCERFWLVHLQEHDDVAPRVFAHGETLGGYDMAWVVMERLWHGPLGVAWSGQEFTLLVEAAVRFYRAAAEVPLTVEPAEKDWHAILRQSRQNVREHGLSHGQRWNQALKRVGKKLPRWLDIWTGRTVDTWCHGDLHFGNALTRVPPPHGPALLIDFARTTPGHWVEDAVYLEHLFWPYPQRLGHHRLSSMIARERKRLNLPVGEDWPRLAQIKRSLLAMSVPAILEHDGDPQHADAALQVLENDVGT